MSKLIRFEQQNYEKIKKGLLKRKELFVDKTFLANDSTLTLELRGEEVTWKRPSELLEEGTAKDIVPRSPCLFNNDRKSRGRLTQGDIGNCWFIATAQLVMRKPYKDKIIPNIAEQDWHKSNHTSGYAGIFHFRFYRFGSWVDVVVDDRLPSIGGGRLWYARMGEDDRCSGEMWGPLLEKAYAKLCGGYDKLVGGFLADALIDLTGGIVEAVDVQGTNTIPPAVPDKLFVDMKKAFDANVPMTAAVSGQKVVSSDSNRNTLGLHQGHVYGITAVTVVKKRRQEKKNPRERLKMIRLRDPNNSSTWAGEYCRSSLLWSDVSEKKKKRLKVQDEQQFWVTIDEFCQNFSRMAICHMMMTTPFTMQKRWHESVKFGRWKQSSNHREQPVLNQPQFVFQLNSHKEEEIVIELMQTKRELSSQCISYAQASIIVLRVAENRRYRVHLLQEHMEPGRYKNSRSVFRRCLLQPGRYVIIAASLAKQEECTFMLRLYTPQKNYMRELIKDQPTLRTSRFLQRFNVFKNPTMVTRVLVNHIEWTLQPKYSEIYAVLQCEGQDVRGQIIKIDDSITEFKTSAIFYRKFPKNKDVVIKVYGRRLILSDKLIVRCNKEFDDEICQMEYMTNIFNYQEHDNDKKPIGKMKIQVTSSAQLDTV